MTTSAAENVAGRAGDKEKVEKRRALGRGLASILPGPRVAGPGQNSGADGKQQIPPFVRNDKANSDDASGSNSAAARGGGAAASQPMGETISGTIRAEVEDLGDGTSRAGAPSAVAQL